MNQSIRLTGGVEHLYAITDLLKKISAYDYSYVHIISGEDFPTRPIDEIESFFDNQSSIFIQCQPCDVNETKRSAWYKFYWPYAGLKQNYKNPLIRYINLFTVGLQKVFPIFQKRKLGEFEKIYTGLIWGSLPKDAVEYILNYIECKNFMEELKWCKIPEEFFFQTILANSEFKNRIVDDNKRYGNFGDGDGSGPTYLKMVDVTRADSQGAFFARKIGKNTDVIKFLKERQTFE